MKVSSMLYVLYVIKPIHNMKLRNNKIKQSMVHNADNEESSQVLANPVAYVQCLGSCSQVDPSAQDDGILFGGQRCSESNVSASHPTPSPPPIFGTPVRTPKHKKNIILNMLITLI